MRLPRAAGGARLAGVAFLRMASEDAAARAELLLDLFSWSKHATIKARRLSSYAAAGVAGGALEGPAPDIAEGLAPDIAEGLEPDIAEGLAPDMLEGLAPDVLEGLEPDALEGLEPDALEGLEPDALVGPAPEPRRRPSFAGGRAGEDAAPALGGAPMSPLGLARQSFEEESLPSFPYLDPSPLAPSPERLPPADVLTLDLDLDLDLALARRALDEENRTLRLQLETMSLRARGAQLTLERERLRHAATAAHAEGAARRVRAAEAASERASRAAAEAADEAQRYAEALARRERGPDGRRRFYAERVGPRRERKGAADSESDGGGEGRGGQSRAEAKGSGGRGGGGAGPGGLCVVCLAEERRVLLLPCRHLCVCEDCAGDRRLERCPLCRAAIEDRMRVYV